MHRSERCAHAHIKEFKETVKRLSEMPVMSLGVLTTHSLYEVLLIKILVKPTVPYELRDCGLKNANYDLEFPHLKSMKH